MNHLLFLTLGEGPDPVQHALNHWFYGEKYWLWSAHVGTLLPRIDAGAERFVQPAQLLLARAAEVHFSQGHRQTVPVPCAHQQIAVLNASTALASQSPGGAGTSYVLAQPGSFALVGASTSTSSGDDHTGRNTALIAIGGVLALAIGLGVGIAMGRSRVAA